MKKETDEPNNVVPIKNSKKSSGDKTVTPMPRAEVHVGNFAQVNGATYQVKPSEDDDYIKLANFVAVIEQEILVDDGLSVERELLISLIREDGTPLGSVKIPADTFNSASWVVSRFGSRAIVSGFTAAYPLLKQAIQLFSPNPKQTTLFLKTGWVVIGDKPYFLHSGGAIGADGPTDGSSEDFATNLSDGLASYSLEYPSSNAELFAALRETFALLELAPRKIIIPLLAAVFYAPLCHFKRADFSVFLAGGTGVGKSELAALFQAFFGRLFTSRNLPANWQSTYNSISYRISVSKDVLTTVDDLVPSEAKTMNTAAMVFRTIRNDCGRGRMTSNLQMRPDPRPNGLILATGEDLPGGHSIRTALVVLPVHKGDLKFSKLQHFQEVRSAGIFAKVTGAYASYLAKGFFERKAAVENLHGELRALGASGDQHARVPDTIASLGVGFHTFLDFAESVGAINSSVHAQHWNEAKKIFLQVGADQSEYQNDEDPCLRFMDLLKELVLSQRGHLVVYKGKQAWPEYEQQWGFKYTPDGYKPMGARLGWCCVDSSELWLIPGIVHAEVCKFASAQGTPFPIPANTLWKRLAERGFIVRSEGEGKNTLKREVEDGNRQRVLVINIDVWNSWGIARIQGEVLP